MMTSTLTVDEMRGELLKSIGSNRPVHLRKKNDQSLFVFIRGFADDKKNIALISDTPDSLGVKIIQVKDIHSLNSSGLRQNKAA